MSAIIVAGNEIIPDTLTVTVDGTTITAKDFQKVLLNINQASATASVADGTDLMQNMEIINKNANACDVSFTGEGGATVKTLKQNQSMRLSWAGSFWLYEKFLITTYSTTEQDTGMTWVDGKKIYQKVFITTSITEDIQTYRTQYYSPYFSVPDIETIIKVEGTFAYNYNGTSGYVEIFGSSSVANDSALSVQWTTFIETQITNQCISFGISKHKAFAMVPTKMTIIAYYTKTTD